MIKFTKLSGDVNELAYGAKFVSPKLNNTEFNYWLVIELINMHEATGDESGPKYIVETRAVSPEAAGPENMRKAFDCVGMPEDAQANELAQVEALDAYGVNAPCESRSGSNAHKLMREAKRNAVAVNGLFGFYMDKAVNRIGSSGWEFLRGDLDSALQRCAHSSDPTQKLVAKISGITN